MDHAHESAFNVVGAGRRRPPSREVYMLQRRTPAWKEYTQRHTTVPHMPPIHGNTDTIQLHSLIQYWSPYADNDNNNNTGIICMVLSSCLMHCESSPGLCDECSTVPGGRRPLDQADRL